MIAVRNAVDLGTNTGPLVALLAPIVIYVAAVFVRCWRNLTPGEGSR